MDHRIDILRDVERSKGPTSSRACRFVSRSRASAWSLASRAGLCPASVMAFTMWET